MPKKNSKHEVVQLLKELVVWNSRRNEKQTPLKKNQTKGKSRAGLPGKEIPLNPSNPYFERGVWK